jgi:hypothetical protein
MRKINTLYGEIKSVRLIAFSSECFRFFGGHQAPSFTNVFREFFIAHGVEFDADPTANADIRRHETLGGLGLEQRGLQAGRHGNPDRDVAIAVVIVSKHHVDFPTDKERGFSMGEFFGGLWQRRA